MTRKWPCPLWCAAPPERDTLGFLYISSRFPVLVSKQYHAISNICIRILFDTTDIVWYWRPWYRMFDIDWYCVSKMALRSRLYPNRRLYQKHLIFDTGTLDIADTVDTGWYSLMIRLLLIRYDTCVIHYDTHMILLIQYQPVDVRCVRDTPWYVVWYI